MSNLFAGGGRKLHMSNGGTEVFVEVMMLAVSARAQREWEYRFAGLLAMQDQHFAGRGTVGFDLEWLDWGPPEERETNRAFVLAVTHLAAARHRWDELGYDPPYAQDYLRAFRAMLTGFDPGTAEPDPGVFPSAAETVAACCARHRILTPIDTYPACVFCGNDTAGSHGERPMSSPYGTGLHR